MELFQFTVSHYNEKVRWALDYKRVPHVRRSLLPGPHKLRIQKMTAQQQVPVLTDGEHVVAGSAAILDYLEKTHPEPPLYPADAGVRRRALEVQRYFDEDVGPEIRVAMFHELLADPRYFVSLLTWDQPLWARAVYRAMFPLIRALMSKEMDITADHAARGRETTRKALDFVAAESARSGYLAGDGFSVADLTAASLLAPTVEMEPSPFGYPSPYPKALRGWWQRWRDHPGTAWVQRMFEHHRKAPPLKA